MSSKRVIITGDYNLHHTLWSIGTKPENQITERIVEWITNLGGILLNQKGVVTHPSRNSNETDSVLDLTFINSEANLQNSINNWTVDPSIAYTSDHYGIRFDIDYHTPIITNTAGEKYNLKEVEKDDWDTTMDEELKRREHPLNLLQTDAPLNETQLDLCEQALSEAIVQTIQKLGKPVKPNTHAKPWWDLDLKHAAKRLASVDVGEMDLDRGQVGELDGVADRPCVVRPRARIEHDGVGEPIEAVQVLDERPLVVGLEEPHGQPELRLGQVSLQRLCGTASDHRRLAHFIFDRADLSPPSGQRFLHQLPREGASRPGLRPDQRQVHRHFDQGVSWRAQPGDLRYPRASR